MVSNDLSNIWQFGDESGYGTNITWQKSGCKHLTIKWYWFIFTIISQRSDLIIFVVKQTCQIKMLSFTHYLDLIIQKFNKQSPKCNFLHHMVSKNINLYSKIYSEVLLPKPPWILHLFRILSLLFSIFSFYENKIELLGRVDKTLENMAHLPGTFDFLMNI